MADLRVDNIPAEIQRRLELQAGLAGQPVEDYLRSALVDLTCKPSLADMTARIATRDPYTGPSSAAVVRESRDER